MTWWSTVTDWRNASTASSAPAAGALDAVEAFRQSVTVDHQVIHGACRRLQQIGAPHGEGVEPQLAGHAVEQIFEGMARVDRTVPAHGAAGRQIGVDPVTVVLDRGNIVEALQQRAGIENSCLLYTSPSPRDRTRSR